MKLTQTGFTVIEGVLILVLVVIIGFTGCRVYTANQNANDSLSKSDNLANQEIVKNSESNNQKADKSIVPEEWVEYENKNLNAHFYYPNELVVSTIPNSDGYLARIEFKIDEKSAFQFQAFETNSSTADELIKSISESASERGASLGNIEKIEINDTSAAIYDFYYGGDGDNLPVSTKRVQIVANGVSYQFESSIGNSFSEFLDVVYTFNLYQ